MRKIIVCIAFVSIGISSFAQRLSFPLKVNAQVGATAFHGDICSSLNCIQPGYSIGIGYRYFLKSRLSFAPFFSVYRLRGEDSKGQNPERNLSFRSDNLSLKVDFLFDMFPYYYKSRRVFSPYTSVGLGVTYFNPKANYQGNWYGLQELQTEGKSYSKLALIVPVGIGCRVKVNNSMTIGIVYHFNLTFSDYLDDISKDYRNIETMNGLTAQLSDRTNELGIVPTETDDGIHWKEGTQRGSNSRKDYYSVLALQVEFDLFKPSIVCP